MKIALAALLATIVSTAAFAQVVPGLSPAMPGQTTVGANLMHQTLVPHTAVHSQLPQQTVVPQTAFPSDHGTYTPFARYPVPSAHESPSGL